MSSPDSTPAPYRAKALWNASGAAGEPYETSVPATRERYWLYGLLFSLTLLTATVVGTAMQRDFDRNLPFDLERSLDIWVAVWRHPSLLLQGLPFSLTLLTILLAHEFGHYMAAVFHRVDASLPYFLPSPFLGTFGAFIRVRSPIYSKRALFDIGIAGPLAGFVFLAPALAIGLAISKIIPGIGHQGTVHFGVTPLEWILTHVIFSGTPTSDICLHPVARAGWIGMFMTAINLLPIGQLDGGHILYSFFPRLHGVISRVLCVLMLIPGVVWELGHLGVPGFSERGVWPGWSFWGLVLLWLGRRHPVVEDPSTLSPSRRTLAQLALLVFGICICLVPFGDI
ncbi:MAG TPA: site-2 protease family protein [Candidatus Solibacter sp.]|nr:site-2 protease family protein [Candidatus Solibacter sp.]